MRNTPEITRGEADLPSSRNVPWFSSALVVAAVVLIHLWRSPDVMLNGRFWAEEGTMWWEHARSHGLISNLLYVPDLAGYLMLNTNVSFVLASFAPLRFEPLVVTWLALFTAASVPLMYLWLSSGSSFPKRLAIVSFLVAGAPLLEPEVFSNAINAQIFLGLGAVVILGFDIDQSKGAWLTGFYLFIAGLSGMYAAVMAPLFIGKAILFGVYDNGSELSPKLNSLGLRTKLFSARRAWVQASVLTLTLFVQLAIFWFQRSAGKVYSTKATKFPSHTAIERFAESNFHSFFGNREGATNVLVNGGLGASGLTVVGAVLVAVIVVSVKNLLTLKLDSYSWSVLSLAFAVGTVFVLVGFADSYPHSRYQVLTSAILGLVILEMVTMVASKIRFAAPLLCGILLLSSVRAIPDDSREFITCPPEKCATWSLQIDEVQAGTRSQYQFWPFSGPWTVDSMSETDAADGEASDGEI